MRFASFPKFALLSLLVGCLALLSGCGSNSASNLALTQGNWSVTAVPSAGAAGTFYIGGNLTQTGNSLAGTLYVVNSGCFDPSTMVAFTGTVNGSNVTLTSPSVQSQVITIAAKGTASGTTATSSTMTGTYTVTGGCDDGDSGSINATTVPSINGTWNGPLPFSQGGANVTLALTLTQAATASTGSGVAGTFAIMGTGVFAQSSCSLSAAVSQAFIAGPYLVVNGSTDDGGEFSYTQVLLNNPASPTSMTGGYSVSGGNCDGDLGNPTFTKQ